MTHACYVIVGVCILILTNNLQSSSWSIAWWYVGILRYVKYPVYSTFIELPIGMGVCCLAIL